mmetsp:Transcript_130525/g.325621  ORF Transcript_130525/g.325621 Transcript_130525/m.325621 type:complete len:251 (+) Transcript_130525:1-753(+)
MQDDRSKQFWLLRRYLRQHNVQSQLSFRVLRYIEYACREQEDVVSEGRVTVLNLLSEQLRNELLYVVSFACMTTHPLFEKAGNISNLGMNQLSSTALAHTFLAVGDVLFSKGTKAAHMFILVSGELQYVKAEDFETGQGVNVKGDDWLCEQVLWSDWIHLGSGLSIVECKMVSIHPQAFADVIRRDIPTFMLTCLYARNFINWLNGLPYGDLSDAFLSKDMRPVVNRFIEDEAHGYDRKHTGRMSWRAST